MRRSTPRGPRPERSRPLVVLDGGSGDILLWIPALICVSVMIAAMLLFGDPTGAAALPPAPANPGSSAGP